MLLLLPLLLVLLLLLLAAATCRCCYNLHLFTMASHADLFRTLFTRSVCTERCCAYAGVIYEVYELFAA